MSGAPPPYTDNKQQPAYPQQPGYPPQAYQAYPQPGAYVYQQPTQVQYATYPQTIYTTQPQAVIIDDCHHHHRDGADKAANLCCLFAGLACLCALCAR